MSGRRHCETFASRDLPNYRANRGGSGTSLAFSVTFLEWRGKFSRGAVVSERLLSVKRDASHYRFSLFTRAVSRTRAIAHVRARV
jgi:hypothetical protein